MKVSPVARYGIGLVWNHLSLRNLNSLERVKSSYLKRVLGLHRSAKLRVVYLLADTNFMVGDIRRQFKLSEAAAFKEFLDLRNSKKSLVNPAFFETPAMTNDHWKGVNIAARHLLTRHAAHGFHHDNCSTTFCSFHDPRDDCLCKFCHEKCL